MRSVTVDKDSTVLVGEQVSDTVAASDVLIRAIGFANKAEKIEKFKAASADLVITSMKELFAYL